MIHGENYEKHDEGSVAASWYDTAHASYLCNEKFSHLLRVKPVGICTTLR